MIVLALAGARVPGGFVGDGLQPLILGEQGRALAHQHDVGGALHHGAGGDDRVAKALEGGDGPGPFRRSVHQAGVQLIGAGQIGRGALAGDIEAGILQHDDGGRGDFQGALARVQTRFHGLDHLAHVGDLGVIVAFAPGAGAAVEDEGGHVVFLSLSLSPLSIGRGAL